MAPASKYRYVKEDDFEGETEPLLLKEKSGLTHRQIRHGKEPTSYRKWAVMISCLVLHMIGSGIGYGLSVMYAELVVVFGAKRSDAALVQGLYMGLTTGGGIVFIGIIKKIGPGPSIILGSLVGSVGIFCSGFTHSIGPIIFLTGGLAGAGMSINYLSALLTVSWIFHGDPSMAVIVLSTGPCIGQFVLPILYEVLITSYSWAGAFVALGAIPLLCLPCGVLIYYSREFFITGSENKEEVKRTSVCDLSLLTDFVICILLINCHLLALTGRVETWFMVDIMVTRGFTLEYGSYVATVIGLSMFIGRFAGTFVRLKFSHIPTINHWVYLNPIVAIAHGLVINLFDYSSILVTCVFYGITYGLIGSLATAIILEATGLERYPQGIAITNVVYGLANVFSGLLGGFIYDTLGEYDLMFYLASGTAVYLGFGSAFVAFFLRRRRLCKQEIDADDKREIIVEQT